MPRLLFSVPHRQPMRCTLGPLGHGRNDPTTRFAADGFWRTTRVASGTATVRVREVADGFEAEAWGDGAYEVLPKVPDWLGMADTATFATDHPFVGRLLDRFGVPRIGRTLDVIPALVAAVCEQKVTGAEAKRAWRKLVEEWGEPAPGPADLMVAPEPGVLAEIPYHALHVVGLEKRRADTVRRVAAHAARLGDLADVPTELAHQRLQAIHGVGVWTSNEVTVVVLGDADAVSVGDFHLKNQVAWGLAGRARGTDEEMVELLEPFRPHRARVIRLLERAGIGAPRRGPRMAPRNIHRH